MKEMIRPSRGRLVVKPLPNDERLDSGLYILQAQSKASGSTGHGQVLESASETYKRGDHVCWEFGAGYKHTLRGTGEVIVLKTGEIIGTIVETEV